MPSRTIARTSAPWTEFVERAGISAGSSIIDFGCGPGYGSLALQDVGMKVLAIDIAENAMDPEHKASSLT